MKLPVGLMPCLSSRGVSALKAAVSESNASGQFEVPLIVTTFFDSSVTASPKGSAVCTAGGGVAGVWAAAGGADGAGKGLADEVGLAEGAGTELASAAGEAEGTGDGEADGDGTADGVAVGEAAGAGDCASTAPIGRAAAIRPAATRRRVREGFISGALPRSQGRKQAAFPRPRKSPHS